MIPADMRKKVSDYLYSFSDSHLYTVIDGASVKGLLEAINKNNPEHCCLLSGKLDSELAQAAPYLIKLDKESPLTEWLLDGWGKHIGIFCILKSGTLFGDVLQHFRNLLTVKTPDNHTVLFRFYDPRVLRIYLPTCTSCDTEQVFGPVKLYLSEGSTEDAVQQYWPVSEGVESKNFNYPPV